MGLFNNQVVGIDIGSASVRAVGVLGGKHPKFVGCKEINLEKPEKKTENVLDVEQIAKVIKECLGNASPKQLKGTRYVTSIPEADVFRKVIELPLAPEAELENAIQLEIAEYLPEDISLMEIDYQVLGLLPDGATQQVMVVGVAKALVEQYMNAFKAASLPLHAVDVRSAALARAVVVPDEQKAIVLISIEPDSTTVSLYQGGIIRVTSVLAMGLDGEEEEVGKGFIASLVDEIDHVIKFYSNRTADHKEVKEVRLAGGGSLLKGLQEGLKKEAGLQVTLAKPIIEAPAFCDRRFLVALGSALYPKDGGRS